MYVGGRFRVRVKIRKGTESNEKYCITKTVCVRDTGPTCKVK